MGNKSERPKLFIRLSRFEIILETAAALLVVFSVVMLAVNWGGIKSKFPSHYGINGADVWTNNRTFLLILLVVIIIFYLFFTALSRFPHLFNYPKAITDENASNMYLLSRTMLTVLKLEVICILFLFEWDMVQKGIGKVGFNSIGFRIFSICFMVIPLVTVMVFAFKLKRS